MCILEATTQQSDAMRSADARARGTLMAAAQARHREPPTCAGSRDATSARRGAGGGGRPRRGAEGDNGGDGMLGVWEGIMRGGTRRESRGRQRNERHGGSWTHTTVWGAWNAHNRTVLRCPRGNRTEDNT